MMSSELNPKQSEAVLHTDGPLLVLAGAGSGKTRVLTFRMARLVSSGKTRPENIFAVTFTNKAAGEMKARVEKLAGMASSRGMWVSTFHSACLKILRRHAKNLGYVSGFTVYDDYDQQRLINQCLEELNLSPKVFHSKSVAWRINQRKNQGLLSGSSGSARNDFEDTLQKVEDLYRQKLICNQAMDFGDLILNVVVLFREHPSILRHYQNFFSHIHVDEYQDTNRCQYMLINLLSALHRNICVVGDDDQSIYKFRGADIRNILDFKRDYPEAHVVRLEENYRSTKVILKAADSVVSHNEGRMGKTLWTKRAKEAV